MKTLPDILQQQHHEKFKFAFADIDGVLRGKLISRQKILDTLEEGIGFCDVVFGWDMADQAYDNTRLTGWHTGYPDRPARIDWSTLRLIPWQQDLPFVLADFSGKEGEEGLASCPRTLMKKITAQATDMGFITRFAQEFEWFNFQETAQSLEARHYVQPVPLTPGMFGYSILRTSGQFDYYETLFDQLTRFGIPIEGLHTETGPGVYEAAIQYDTVLNAADKAVLFKTGVKEIANQFGLIASFMAKWNEELPGCSGHIHQSLWSLDGSTNRFYDEKASDKMSVVFRHYLAGQLYCLPHLLPMYAPTINSYKRLVEGAWAPTTHTWGYDNRTTAFRVLNSSQAYTRLETRIPGSDTNPYLAMSAALASGLYGIRHQLPLNLPPTTGNGYLVKDQGVLHRGLHEATVAMQTSSLARELFGEAFVDHFTATRFWECRQHDKAVTDWERKRYFEII